MSKRKTRFVWWSGVFMVTLLAGWTLLPASRTFTEKNAKAAFGELLTAEPTPVVQIQFPYNINTDIIEKRENNLGTITQADGMAVIQSGASANSAAHLLSRIPVKYNPGQGASVPFTALFTAGAAGSIQVGGVAEVGDGLLFGFNGTAFSILQRKAGGPEIQTLTITTGAVTATGDITINVDSVAKVVAVTSGDSVRQVAVKIADAAFNDTGLGWTTFVNNSTIIFKAWSDGNKAGTFSLVDTDTTGTVGSFAETVAGAATTLSWIAQTAWNKDKFDGTGSSGVTLDPTKGNVYKIQYQWLGFGDIDFSIENPTTKELVLVHRIEYSNANIVPSLQNPTLPLHIMAKNTSNTTNLTVKTSSMAGFTEGRIIEQSLLNSMENDIANLGTTELPILSIKNNVVHQVKINRVRVRPEFLSLATESTKPIVFRIKLNPTLTGTPAFTDVSAATSVVATDVAASGITGGREFLTIVLGKTDSKLIALHELDKALNPGDVISVTAQATSGSNQEVDVSLTWAELF